METKTIKINETIPEGYEAVELVIRKKEETLPKTWEEFCEISRPKEKESFIDKDSKIIPIIQALHHRRSSKIDRNLWPSKEYAEAALALSQLVQLRDCYNQGWEPDWTNRETKWVISYSEEAIHAPFYTNNQHVLAFKTRELRDEFLANFESLIKIAKPLI